MRDAHPSLLPLQHVLIIGDQGDIHTAERFALRTDAIYGGTLNSWKRFHTFHVWL